MSDQKAFELIGDLGLNVASAASSLLQWENALKASAARMEREGERAGDSFGQKFANSSIAAIGSSFRSAVDGDLRGIFNSVNNLAADALQAIPGIGSGLSSAYKDVTGAMMDAVETGFAYDDMLKRHNAAFTLITGNVHRAAEEMEILSNIAAHSEFGKPQIFAVAEHLQVMGLRAERIPAAIQGIANAASGLGGGAAAFDRISNSFARILELDKVSTRDVRSLINSNIDVYGLLAESLGTSKRKAKQLMDEGVIDARDFIQLMINALNDPKYKQAADEAAQTVEVQGQKLVNNLAAIKGQSVQALHDSSTAALTELNDLLRSDASKTVAAMANQATAPAAALIQKTLNALKTGDIFGGALETGRSLITGFEKGISDNLSTALGAVHGMVGAIMEAVKGSAGFDTHSPSKKFIEVGKDSADGWALVSKKKCCTQSCPIFRTRLTTSSNKRSNTQRPGSGAR
jgi:tape measure domain-containing protein